MQLFVLKLCIEIHFNSGHGSDTTEKWLYWSDTDKNTGIGEGPCMFQTAPLHIYLSQYVHLLVFYSCSILSLYPHSAGR